MRVFVSIELAPALQQRLVKATYYLRPILKGKWVEQNNLHLTLAFIGEVEEGRVPALLDALAMAAASLRPFELVFTSLVGLPPKSPRVAALSIKPSSEYKSLQKAVLNNLKKLNLSPKSYDPHLTLVRLRSPLAVLPVIKPLNVRFDVKQLSLIQSNLTSKGPIYKRLKALKLSSEELQARLRPNIAICVINPKNEVLLIRSSQHNPRDWQFPQGGIETKESLEQAAKRELLEEVGIEKIRVLSILERVYKYHWPKRLIKLSQGHSKEGFIGQEQSLALVLVNELRPILKLNPREASASKWVHLSKLLKAISPVRRGLAEIAMVELNKIIPKHS